MTGIEAVSAFQYSYMQYHALFGNLSINDTHDTDKSLANTQERKQSTRLMQETKTNSRISHRNERKENNGTSNFAIKREDINENTKNVGFTQRRLDMKSWADHLYELIPYLSNNTSQPK